MEVREFDGQGEIEPDSWKGCRYSASFHHLAAAAVAYDVVVAVAQSGVAVAAAAVVGRPAVGHVAAGS